MVPLNWESQKKNMGCCSSHIHEAAALETWTYNHTFECTTLTDYHYTKHGQFCGYLYRQLAIEKFQIQL